MMIAAIFDLPLPYFIIVEAWVKDMTYTDYEDLCKFYRCSPIDSKLYAVYIEALQEEYLLESTDIFLA